MISLDTPLNDDEPSALDRMASSDVTHEETMVIREATKEEIIELSEQMLSFGVYLVDVADNSPKQERTLRSVQSVVAYAKDDELLMENFLRTKLVPLAELATETNVARKTIERHRKYIIALLLIYSNGYEIIRGHLAEVMKGVIAK